MKKKAKKQTGKQLFPLLFSLCLVLILAALLFFMLGNFSSFTSAKNATASPAPGPVLLQLSASQINTISVTTPHQSFQLSNLGDRLSMDGWEEIPLAFQPCQNLLSALTYLPARQSLGRLDSLSPSQLTLYGLDFPSYIIQILPVASPKITLQIGTSNGSETYVALGQSVFSVLTEQLAPFLLSKNDYVSPSITPDLPTAVTKGSITLSGSVRPKPLSIGFTPTKEAPSQQSASPEKNTFPYSQYQFFLSAPVQTNIPADSARPVIGSLYGLTADKVVAAKPTSTQLHQLGLNAPFSTARTDLDGQGFSLIASAIQPDGSVYVMNQAIPVVYQVQAENVPWITAQYEVLAKAVFLAGSPDDVRQVQITSPNFSYTFYLWKGETTCNGQLLPQGKFDEFYKKVLSITPTAYTWESPEETAPLVTVQVTYTDSSRPVDTLSLLPYTAEEVFLTFNGETRFVTRRALAQNILDNCQNVLDRQPISVG